MLLHHELRKSHSQSFPKPRCTSPGEAPTAQDHSRMAGSGYDEASLLWGGGQKSLRGQQVPGRGRNPSFGLCPGVSPSPKSGAVSPSLFLWLVSQQSIPEHLSSAPPGARATCHAPPPCTCFLLTPGQPRGMHIPIPFLHHGSSSACSWAVHTPVGATRLPSGASGRPGAKRLHGL